jgi:hypothetical protein
MQHVERVVLDLRPQLCPICEDGGLGAEPIAERSRKSSSPEPVEVVTYRYLYEPASETAGSTPPELLSLPDASRNTVDPLFASAGFATLLPKIWKTRCDVRARRGASELAAARRLGSPRSDCIMS